MKPNKPGKESNRNIANGEKDSSFRHFDEPKKESSFRHFDEPENESSFRHREEPDHGSSFRNVIDVADKESPFRNVIDVADKESPFRSMGDPEQGSSFRSNFEDGMPTFGKTPAPFDEDSNFQWNTKHISKGLDDDLTRFAHGGRPKVNQRERNPMVKGNLIKVELQLSEL